MATWEHLWFQDGGIYIISIAHIHIVFNASCRAACLNLTCNSKTRSRHLPLVVFYWVCLVFCPLSSCLLVVLMLTCYLIKRHIGEEPGTALTLSGNESVQLNSDRWKGAEMGGERSCWGTYTDTFRPRVTLRPSWSLQQRKDCWRGAFVTITVHMLRGKLDSATWSETRHGASLLPVWSCQDLKLYFIFSHLNSWQQART